MRFNVLRRGVDRSHEERIAQAEQNFRVLEADFRESLRKTILMKEGYDERSRRAQERIDRLGRLLATEIRAHDETKRVLVERQDQAGRVQYLERELKDMESSRENLTDIADGLRNELLALKAKRRKR